MNLLGEKMSESITPAKYVFTTNDCMGNKVGLKRDTYDYKIFSDHKEVTPDLIKEGVENPHLVFIDEIPNRYDYYKLILNPVVGKTDLIHLMVVVESTKDEYAEVVSAHIRRKTKGEIVGGGLIYDASSSSNRSGIQFQI